MEQRALTVLTGAVDFTITEVTQGVVPEELVDSGAEEATQTIITVGATIEEVEEEEQLEVATIQVNSSP